MSIILFKAKSINPHSMGKWIEGFYANKKETTYCFTEDYERFPVKTLHYIICDEMTDWGLPNRLRAYDVDGNTLCMSTGIKCYWTSESKTDKDGFLLSPEEDNKTHSADVWEHDLLEMNTRDGNKVILEVKFEKGQFILSSDSISGPISDFMEDSECLNMKHLGNAFDNKELLTEV